jgi:ribosomal protein S18 acetylase RimI-like enzyme
LPSLELHDRHEIAAVLRRNAPAHVYELGDLDDFDWPFTRWFGWETDGTLDHAVLLYTLPSVPVLIAIADEPDGTMPALLGGVRNELPGRIYVHVTASLLDVLAERYAVETAEPHLKLALARPDLLDAEAADVDVLGEDDLDDLMALYDDAYPETWFEPRLLATGRYVGIRRDGQLACVAGVHVHSPRWGVAALGNVATLPELRGQGLARGACAALCLLLLGDGIETIGLNVHRDNDAAVRAYTRLGFEPVTEYTEASLVVERRRSAAAV